MDGASVFPHNRTKPFICVKEGLELRKAVKNGARTHYWYMSLVFRQTFFLLFTLTSTHVLIMRCACLACIHSTLSFQSILSTCLYLSLSLSALLTIFVGNCNAMKEKEEEKRGIFLLKYQKCNVCYWVSWLKFATILAPLLINMDFSCTIFSFAICYYYRTPQGSSFFFLCLFFELTFSCSALWCVQRFSRMRSVCLCNNISYCSW